MRPRPTLTWQCAPTLKCSSPFAHHENWQILTARDINGHMYETRACSDCSPGARGRKNKYAAKKDAGKLTLSGCGGRSTLYLLLKWKKRKESYQLSMTASRVVLILLLIRSERRWWVSGRGRQAGRQSPSRSRPRGAVAPSSRLGWDKFPKSWNSAASLDFLPPTSLWRQKRKKGGVRRWSGGLNEKQTHTAALFGLDPKPLGWCHKFLSTLLVISTNFPQAAAVQSVQKLRLSTFFFDPSLWDATLGFSIFVSQWASVTYVFVFC